MTTAAKSNVAQREISDLIYWQQSKVNFTPSFGLKVVVLKNELHASN